MSRCARVYLKRQISLPKAMIRWPHVTLSLGKHGVVSAETPEVTPLLQLSGVVLPPDPHRMSRQLAFELRLRLPPDELCAPSPPRLPRASAIPHARLLHVCHTLCSRPHTPSFPYAVGCSRPPNIASLPYVARALPSRSYLRLPVTLPSALPPTCHVTPPLLPAHVPRPSAEGCVSRWHRGDTWAAG